MAKRWRLIGLIAVWTSACGGTSGSAANEKTGGTGGSQPSGGTGGVQAGGTGGVQAGTGGSGPSGGTGGSSMTGAIPEDQLATTWAQSLCPAMAQCCLTNNFAYDPQQCLTNAKALVDALVLQVNNLQVVYDAT